MDWLTGFSVMPDPGELVPEGVRAQYEIHANDLYAQAGGPLETCHSGELFGVERFLVTSVGIFGGQILQSGGWSKYLSDPEADLRLLYGHFVVF